MLIARPAAAPARQPCTRLIIQHAAPPAPTLPPLQAKTPDAKGEAGPYVKPAAHSGKLKSSGTPAVLRKRSEKHLANVTKRGLVSESKVRRSCWRRRRVGWARTLRQLAALAAKGLH